MTGWSMIGCGYAGINCRDGPGRGSEKIPDEQGCSRGEYRCGGDQHQEVHLQFQLRIEVAQAEDPLQVNLPDASRAEGERHAEHSHYLHPESPVAKTASFHFTITGEVGQGIADHGQHCHGIGAIERPVSMHGGDERAVRPFVDARPGVRESEQTGTEYGKHRAADGPVNGQ